MIAQVLVPLANGFEEIEATCPIDLLRRAEVEVITASCQSEPEVCGRSGITIKADQQFDDVRPEKFDLLVLPGGPAVFELCKKDSFLSFIRSYAELKRPIGAICAAPLLLQKAGVLQNRKFTAHSSVVSELPEMLHDRKVVKDNLLITSQGAGTAVEFGLALVELLKGSGIAQEIRASIHA